MSGRQGSPAPGDGLQQRRTDRAVLSGTAGRVAVLVLLLAGVFAAIRLANQPSLAISVYALIPILLSVFWFELTGGLLTATAATLLFLGDELASPSPELADGTLWIALLNRALVFFGAALLLTLLVRRERALSVRVQTQQDTLTELESLRAALTPTAVPVRPNLQFATAFTPADGLVAGDFFLVVPGSGGSTTVVVGDVVGHGLEAARCAAFVRSALATFARFTSDPVQLLQLANAALVEQAEEGTRFVTAVCLVICPPPGREILWAAAGHDTPWELDTGEPLSGGRVGFPLGIGTELPPVEVGRGTLPPGQGILLFTDGLTEARSVQRGPDGALELFGEDRARRIVQDHRGAPPAEVLDALVAAVTGYSGGPLADDLCLVAVRAEPLPG
jgi:sigma-B regulation protein RsbU (phosphoserine phosphatase)